MRRFRASMAAMLLALAAGLAWSGSAPAWARPGIRLESAPDFNSARAGAIPEIRTIAGLPMSGVLPPGVVPLPEMPLGDLRAIQQTYGVGSESQLRDTVVYTNTPDIDGQVGATGTDADLGSTIIGAFICVYRPDPNLVGTFLDVTLYLPDIATTGPAGGIDAVGISLIDANGLVKLWRFDSSVLTAGNRNFFLFSEQGAGAGGSTFFFQDAAFDLTQVLRIQVNYRGMPTQDPVWIRPAPDPGSPMLPNPNVGLWVGNPRFVVGVIPEPGTLLLLALGAAPLAAWRRARRTNR